MLDIEANRKTGKTYWRLAWVLYLLSIALNLHYFMGFGLGDDVNDLHIANYTVEIGKLDPTRSESYRLITTAGRSIFVALFGCNEVSFILLPFLAVKGASIVLIFFCRDLFGGRGAFLVAFLLLCSPFETLSATANLTDYIHGFFGVLAAWNITLGYVRGNRSNMYLGAAAILGAVLNKSSGMALLPTAAIATFFSLTQWRRWIPFWQAIGTLFLGLCLWDVWFSGKPLRWLLFNNFFEGYDMTDQLASILLILPRDIFWKNIHDGRFFGFISWLSACGVLLALAMWCRGRGGIAAAVVVLYCLVSFLFFNFLPHKLTLSGYYSHYRVWRYIGQIAPTIYLAAVFLIEVVNAKAPSFTRSLPILGERRLLGSLGSVLGICVALHALWTLPETVAPSVDANRDGRKLVAYIRENPFPHLTKLHVDFVKCMWLTAVLYPTSLQYRIDCFASLEKEKTFHYLSSIKSGVVVTGGAALGWYGNPDLTFDLEWSGFKPPPNWRLLYQYDAPIAQWRREPLRVWMIESTPGSATSTDAPPAAVVSQSATTPSTDRAPTTPTTTPEP